jgi:hypothetical protein
MSVDLVDNKITYIPKRQESGNRGLGSPTRGTLRSQNASFIRQNREDQKDGRNELNFSNDQRAPGSPVKLDELEYPFKADGWKKVLEAHTKLEEVTKDIDK